MDRSNLDFVVRSFLALVVGLFVLVMALGCIAFAVGGLLGWTGWHSMAFAVAAVLFVYYVRIWLQSNVVFQLDRPVIGLPIVFLFLLIIYQGHFAPNGDPRPVTMAISLLAFAPFFALTLFNLVGLNR